MNKINVSILVGSVRYIKTNFDIVCALSTWIYQELSVIKYDDQKLIRSFQRKDLVISESILNMNYDGEVLNDLLRSLLCYDKGIKPNETILYSQVKLILTHNPRRIDQTLIDASYLGFKTVVKLLLENGYKPTNSALYYASYYGYTCIIKYLLQYGAIINLRIFLAACMSKCCNTETIKVLLESGADVYIDNILTSNCSCYPNQIIELLKRYKLED